MTGKLYIQTIKKKPRRVSSLFSVDRLMKYSISNLYVSFVFQLKEKKDFFPSFYFYRRGSWCTESKFQMSHVASCWLTLSVIVAFSSQPVCTYVLLKGKVEPNF